MSNETLLLLGGGLAIVSLVALIALLRLLRMQRQNKRPNLGLQDYQREKSGRIDPRDVEAVHRARRARQRLGGQFMTFLLFALIAAGLIGFAIWDWQHYDFASEWPITLGRVTEIPTVAQNVEERDGGFYSSYTMRVPFIYQVNGQWFDGTIQHHGLTEADRNRLQNVYQMGTESAVVWHHPMWGQLYFTYPFGALYNVALLVVGGIFALLMLVALYQVFKLASIARNG